LQDEFRITNRQTLKTQAQPCCDSHQSAVADFIAGVRTTKLTSIYPPHFTRDPRPQQPFQQFTSSWHGDCL
jgi:hypothetical protein